MPAPTRLRHDCDTQGCFNKYHRLKFQLFEECFDYPKTRINFSDLDGIVERHGHFLALEWKSSDCGEDDIKAIKRLLQQLVSGDNESLALIVWGDACEMKPERILRIDNFVTKEVEPCDIEKLKEIVARWFKRVNSFEWMDEV